MTHPVPLEAGGSLPGSAYGRDGTLWITSERATRVNGKITHVGVQVARSADDGRTWRVLPEVPGTTTGTSTFVALGAGRAGHVGLVLYRTAAAGDPGAVPGTSRWDAVYAESTDALSKAPHWTVTTVDKGVHTGVICATAGCVGAGRFAGDFLDTTFDAHDRPSVVSMRNRPSHPTVNEIRYTGATIPATVAPRPPAAPGPVTAPAAPGPVPAPAAPGRVPAPAAPSRVAAAQRPRGATLPITGLGAGAALVGTVLVLAGLVTRRRRPA